MHSGYECEATGLQVLNAILKPTNKNSKRDYPVTMDSADKNNWNHMDD